MAQELAIDDIIPHAVLMEPLLTLRALHIDKIGVVRLVAGTV